MPKTLALLFIIQLNLVYENSKDVYKRQEELQITQEDIEERLPLKKKLRNQSCWKRAEYCLLLKCVSRRSLLEFVI